MKNPLCKVCGKPAPKITVTHWFGNDRPGHPGVSVNHPEKPATREEAQRLVNGEIVSMKMSWRSEAGPRYVASANVWDGESYLWDGHFHAQGCAAAFGLAMAKQFPDHAMPAYRKALGARRPGQ
ncbi:MAG TPA: hypothetical protein VGF33_07705 [Caulobacteraceae bacterium]